MELVQWQERFERWLKAHHATDDAAHDISHFRRVWHTSQRLMKDQGGDALVSLPKNHPQRGRSSQLASAKAIAILREAFADFPAHHYAAIQHAIEAHSFSAGITPLTVEAKIVQDADRLEALGAIGLARVFAVSGALGVPLFDPEDPFADARELNDRAYALDHFQTKLLRLPETMQTDAGRQLARQSADVLIQFMARLSAELRGDYDGIDTAVLQRFRDSL